MYPTVCSVPSPPPKRTTQLATQRHGGRVAGPEQVVLRPSEPHKYVMRWQTRKTLRSLFVTSMEKEVEYGGVFRCVPSSGAATSLCDYEMSLPEGFQPTEGTNTEVKVADSQFSFHTHPIRYEGGLPVNYANLIGNEDLIAVVEDDQGNTCVPESQRGVGVFDVLCAPIGMFVYGAGPEVLAKWRECYEESCAAVRAPPYKSRRTGKLTSNGMVAVGGNPRFDAFIGDQYWDSKGDGEFCRLKATFQYLGYSKWWPDKENLLSQAERSWGPKEEQLYWLKSEQFLKIDWTQDLELLAYLASLRMLGFSVLFFPWGPVHRDMMWTWPPKEQSKEALASAMKRLEELPDPAPQPSEPPVDAVPPVPAQQNRKVAVARPRGGGGGCGGGGCGGGGCAGCPSAGKCCQGPIALLAWPRAAVEQLVASAASSKEEQPQVVLVADPEKGILLQHPSSSATPAAEFLDFEKPVDPLTSWSYEDLMRSSSKSVLPDMATFSQPLAVISTALSVSSAPNPVFFALFDNSGSYSLKPVPYRRLPDAEYSAALVPQQWPPAGLVPGANVKGTVVKAAFVVDNMGYALEQIRTPEQWLYTSKAPEVGQNLFVAVALASQGQPGHPANIKMAGRVTSVGPLPAEGAPVDAVVGKSYFETCTCGKDHPRDELLKELGALHGQRIQAVLQLTPEQVGLAPELAGQWDAGFVADDTRQMLWQLETMTSRPRDQWGPWISR